MFNTLRSLVTDSRARVAMSSAALVALGGCASTRSNSEGVSTTSESQELRSTESAPTQGSESDTAVASPAVPVAGAAGVGAFSEDQFNQMLRGIPRENVSVIVEVPDERRAENDRRRDRALAVVVNEPVVDQFAALGAYLQDRSARADAGERLSIQAMSELALRIAHRVSLADSNLGAETAAQLRNGAARELSEWFRRDNQLKAGDRDVYAVEGRAQLARYSENNASSAASNPTESLENSFHQALFLREAIARYGGALWGYEIANNRSQSTAFIIGLLQKDATDREGGMPVAPEIVAANAEIGRVAQRLAQVITLGADPLIPTLRELDVESGRALAGASASDASGYALFLQVSGEAQSMDSLKRYVLIRSLPLDRLCTGSNTHAAVTPTEEQSEFFQSSMRRLGLLN